MDINLPNKYQSIPVADIAGHSTKSQCFEDDLNKSPRESILKVRNFIFF